jgi:hypothetical protein
MIKPFGACPQDQLVVEAIGAYASKPQPKPAGSTTEQRLIETYGVYTRHLETIVDEQGRNGGHALHNPPRENDLVRLRHSIDNLLNILRAEAYLAPTSKPTQQ